MMGAAEGLAFLAVASLSLTYFNTASVRIHISRWHLDRKLCLRADHYILSGFGVEAVV